MTNRVPVRIGVGIGVALVALFLMPTHAEARNERVEWVREHHASVSPSVSERVQTIKNSVFTKVCSAIQPSVGTKLPGGAPSFCAVVPPPVDVCPNIPGTQTNPSDCPPPPAVVLTFGAVPGEIDEGQTSTLSWNATNADSCTASGAWSGARPLSGTLVVSPTETSSYTLTCEGDGPSDVETVTITVNDPELPTITEIVVADARFDTLEAAVVAALLADDLNGTGPFTVFAPTDDAFAALPEGVLTALLSDPTGNLVDILLYHVLLGEFDASDVIAADMLETLLGQDVNVTVTGDSVRINNALIIQTNIEASNGIIHVIDAVLIPADEPEPSVVVSEIAWMGYGGDINNEWIELKNPGSTSADITGWTLVATDGTPSITLSGTIPAGGFFLLERTDDTSVPEKPADQIYSGALGNAGETLTLKNAGAVVVDTVVGGASWVSIGGDATTGTTPQRKNNGTWVTATPTPKAATVE